MDLVVAGPNVDDCWKWLGNKSKHGYGRITINNEAFFAHRLAYELFVGPIPKGFVVCHSCDIPPCVNPRHLRADYQTGNVKEMWEKGRGKNPPIHQGETHHKAKLTKADVRDIIKVYNAAPIVGNRKKFGTVKGLAKQYGVCKNTILWVVNGTYWKELNEAS